MLGAKPFAEVLHDFCVLAVASIPDVDEASIVLIEDRAPTVSVAPAGRICCPYPVSCR